MVPKDSNSADGDSADSLQNVRDELGAEFSGIFSPETVTQFVDESAALFDSPGIDAFLPHLVRRYARDLLHSLARSSGFVPKVCPEVLFVCVHNAGRSQMAAALLEHHSKRHPINVRCAGTQPASELYTGVKEVMAEIDVYLTAAFPKPLHRQLVEAADVVITMGCGDACPILPGRVYENWNLPDPTGMSLDQLRQLRDDIDSRVRALIDRLLAMGSLKAW